MNENNYPEYIVDFFNYLRGIKNFSENYVLNVITTLKQFLELIFYNMWVLRSSTTVL